MDGEDAWPHRRVNNGLAIYKRSRDGLEPRSREILMPLRRAEISRPFRLWNRFSFGDNISYSVISHSAQILRNCIESVA